MSTSPLHIAVLHGAGYAGGALLELLLAHPLAEVVGVTSRSQAGKPVWATHARLRGQTDLAYVAPDDLGTAFDVAFVCAEHGQGAHSVVALRAAGFEGVVVDLSADHRLDAETYTAVYGLDHPDPAALDGAVYGLAERLDPASVAGATLLAAPGCFATGISLALAPLADLGPMTASVTALTGASGSGARPSATTHFPSRDGNVRAYRVFDHRHLAEVRHVLGPGADVRFVPASGPWTRGIWGTAHVATDASADAIDAAFEAAYDDRPLVRLSPGALPELLPVVGTPFCDVGWVHGDGHVVVGFALDNLLKGAAAQAVQLFNLSHGWPEALGLLPGVAVPLASPVSVTESRAPVSS
ncbi:N-acetyl-gamma-glutamyl-phosphate reductase [Rubrivirga sp. IMCC43871]|uniref:N-acetyl-gamma-glutamyl-phosphate reductase n=1 Tax=Rubrivirga sp. IMCC43871 TaxID=3391575 RepID=UPI00398FCF14